MRILYHHRTQGRGVEAVHIRGLVVALRERGHHVEVLSPPGCDPFAEPKVAAPGTAIARPARHPVWRAISKYCPQLVFEGLELAYNLYAMRRLSAVPAPDVILERYFVFSMAAGRVARRRGCQIIYEINDSSFLQQRVRGLALVRLARVIERRVLRRADLVVAVSRKLAAMLEQEVGVDPKRILVLPNAIHESSVVAEAAATEAPPADEVVIGFVGLFVPWHGLHMLVDAIADLLKDGLRVRLLLVGDGPVRPEVEARARERGVLDQVTITGTVPHDEVASWLGRVDIAALPDSNDYGSPMKIFEYMAAGKAIVAPDYPPVLEVMEPGVVGLVFPRRNVPALRDALAQLVRDAALRQRLGARARQQVLKEHTWARNAERLVIALQAAPPA